MPTYVYRRLDGTTFEISQRITEPALERCPETGQPVQRVISANTGLIFKGSGFYLTDYARKNSSTGSNGKSTESSAKPDAGTTSTTPAADKKP